MDKALLKICSCQRPNATQAMKLPELIPATLSAPSVSAALLTEEHRAASIRSVIVSHKQQSCHSQGPARHHQPA